MSGGESSKEVGRTEAYQAPWLKPAFDAAQKDVFDAGQNPFTQQAINYGQAQLNNPNSLTGQSQNALGGILSGDPNNPMNKALTNNVISQVESRFAQGGRLNSGAAREAMASGIGNALAGNMMSAIPMAQNVQNAPMSQYQQLAGLSDFRRKNINDYIGMLQGNYGSTEYKTSADPSLLGTIAGVALPAAGMMFGGPMGGMAGSALAGGLTGGAGGAGGAGGGALGGGMPFSSLFG